MNRLPGCTCYVLAGGDTYVDTKCKYHGVAPMKPGPIPTEGCEHCLPDCLGGMICQHTKGWCPPPGAIKTLNDQYALRVTRLSHVLGHSRYLWRSSFNGDLIMWLEGPGWCRRVFGWGTRGFQRWRLAGPYKSRVYAAPNLAEVFIRVAERRP